MRFLLSLICLLMHLQPVAALEMTISEGTVFTQEEIRSFLEHDRAFATSCIYQKADAVADTAGKLLLIALKQAGYNDATVTATPDADGEGISLSINEGQLWTWADVTATGALTPAQVLEIMNPDANAKMVPGDNLGKHVKAFIGTPANLSTQLWNSKTEEWRARAELKGIEVDAFTTSATSQSPGRMVLNITSHRVPSQPIDGIVINIEPRNASMAMAVRTWLAERGVSEGLSPHRVAAKNVLKTLSQSEWFVTWHTSDSIVGGQRILTIKARPEPNGAQFPTPSSGTIAAVIAGVRQQRSAWGSGQAHCGLEYMQRDASSTTSIRVFTFGTGFIGNLRIAQESMPAFHVAAGFHDGQLWIADAVSGHSAAWRIPPKISFFVKFILGVFIDNKGNILQNLNYQLSMRNDPEHEFSLDCDLAAIRFFLTRNLSDYRVRAEMSTGDVTISTQSATKSLLVTLGSATSAQWCLARMPRVPLISSSSSLAALLGTLAQPLWDIAYSQQLINQPSTTATGATPLFLAIRDGILHPLGSALSNSATISATRLSINYYVVDTSLTLHLIARQLGIHWPAGSWPDHAFFFQCAFLDRNIAALRSELQLMASNESHGPLAWLTMATLASYADKRLSAQLASLGVVKCDAPTFANDVVALLEPLPIFARWLQHTDPRALVAPITDPALRARAEQELRALIAAAPGTARRTALRTCATTLWNLGLGTLIEQRLRALSESTP